MSSHAPKERDDQKGTDQQPINSDMSHVGVPLRRRLSVPIVVVKVCRHPALIVVIHMLEICWGVVRVTTR